MWLFGKKKKKQQDDFFSLLKDAMKEASENVETVGKAILERQAPDRSDFGRSEANPIFTSSLMGTESYFARLCTKDGRKFTWVKKASTRATVWEYEDVGEDVYTLYLDGEKYIDLYVVPYAGESEFPPAGLYFCDDDTDWDLEREAFGKGMTSAQLLEFREIMEENEREIQNVQNRREEAIIKKSAHIGEKYADFSIDAELGNPDFVNLCKFDIDALTIYEYCHRNRLSFKRITETTIESEIPDSGYYFDILHDIEQKEFKRRRGDRQKSDDDLKKEAEVQNIPLENLRWMRKQEEETAELGWKLRVQELHSIAKQAISVKKSYPKFDLSIEWENTIFRDVTKKLGMLTAYEVIHFSSCYSQVSDESVSEDDPNQERTSEKMTEEKLFCRKCGTQLLLDSLFCFKCGTKVEKYM